MKKAKTRQMSEATGDRDTMRPEYDFSGAVRGVTAARYAKGTNIVVVDPEVLDVFPNSGAVNEALELWPRCCDDGRWLASVGKWPKPGAPRDRCPLAIWNEAEQFHGANRGEQQRSGSLAYGPCQKEESREDSRRHSSGAFS